MKRRIDGRTAKGVRIRQQVRERILTGYIELIREGVPSQTARATATRGCLRRSTLFTPRCSWAARLWSIRIWPISARIYRAAQQEHFNCGACRLHHEPH